MNIMDQIAFFNPVAGIVGMPEGVTITERIHDTITLTRHPVQQGAMITDHKYKNPVEIHVDAAWDNPGTITQLIMDVGGIVGVYQNLISLQSSDILFDYIATNGLMYKNMQLKAVIKHTDPRTYNILALSLAMEQVILVTPKNVDLPADSQKEKEKTSSTVVNGKQTPVQKQESILKKIGEPVMKAIGAVKKYFGF